MGDKKISLEEVLQKNLVLLMDHENVKLRDLAELLDVSTTTVCSWRTGRNSPSLASITRICELYNIPYRDILSETIRLPYEKEAPDTQVVCLQEVDFIRRRRKFDLNFNYSVRTMTLPRDMLKGYPEEEVRLLCNYSDRYDPVFLAWDRLLLHLQEEAQQDDYVLAFMGGEEPSLRRVEYTQKEMVLYPLDPMEKVYLTPIDKTDDAEIIAKVIGMIREF